MATNPSTSPNSESLPEATVQQMKDEAQRDLKAVLNQLDRDMPGVRNPVAATAGGVALGSLGGLTFSTAWLSSLGIPGSLGCRDFLRLSGGRKGGCHRLGSTKRGNCC